VRRLLIVALGLIAVLGLAAGAASISARNFARSEFIAQHVTIAGVDVGKLRTTEAEQKLEREWLPTLPETLTLTVDSQEHKLSAADLGREPQLRQAVVQAWRIGREGNVLTQLVTRLRMMKAPIDVPVPITVDGPTLSAELVQLAAEVDHEAVNATVTVTGEDDVEITPGKPGIKLDREAAAKDITAALMQRQSGPVALTCAEAPPRVTAQDLAHLEVVLGSYSTPYSAGKVDRTHNLKLAVEAINKTVILPNEVFSTDQAIGPRLAKRGFREAPIFENGEVTPATGGGICQIATTVYNAALFAGLAMVERHHHSQPVTYAPAGRDATVYAGQLDLKFRNSTGYPILLLASLSGSRVQVRILGKREANKKVRLERSGVSSIPYTKKKDIPDKALPLGKRKVEKKGRNGIKVTVYRIIVQPDGTEKRETLHTDVYKPQAEEIHVGTGPPDVYRGTDGKPIKGPDGKPVPVKLGPDGKPLPYTPPAKGKPAVGANGKAPAATGTPAQPTGKPTPTPAAKPTP
jgi:vancomycin resistance protein YoaR